MFDDECLKTARIHCTAEAGLVTTFRNSLLRVVWLAHTSKHASEALKDNRDRENLGSQT